MTVAVAATSDRKQRDQAEHGEQAEVAWRQRALNAEDALKSALTAAKRADVSLGVEHLVVRLPECRCPGPGRRPRGW